MYIKSINKMHYLCVDSIDWVDNGVVSRCKGPACPLVLFLASTCMHFHWIALTCVHFDRNQIWIQVHASKHHLVTCSQLSVYLESCHKLFLLKRLINSDFQGFSSSCLKLVSPFWQGLKLYWAKKQFWVIYDLLGVW